MFFIYDKERLFCEDINRHHSRNDERYIISDSPQGRSVVCIQFTRSVKCASITLAIISLRVYYSPSIFGIFLARIILAVDAL